MSTPSESVAAPAARRRDPRLDFFRGLGMFIILIAHIPGNDFADWLPRRFGFSDAADMFVFCSGLASAMAFARIFDAHGFWTGAARILHRVWQVYWAHIGSFLVVVAVLVGVDNALGTLDYENQLGFAAIFSASRKHVFGLMTLTYLPNYFDILPMYLVMLVLVPVVLLLEKVHKALVAAFILALWLGANLGWLYFIADQADGRQWFFNPFGWALVFFTGFGLARGWLHPPRGRVWIGVAIAVVVLAIPVSYPIDIAETSPLGLLRQRLYFWTDKTNIGLLRYLHFMATAHLAYVWAGHGGVNLRGPVVEITRRAGQQTLAVFLTGLVVAQVLGVALKLMGGSWMAQVLVNVAGIALLIFTARVVSWFKAPPWKRAAGAG